MAVFFRMIIVGAAVPGLGYDTQMGCPADESAPMQHQPMNDGQKVRFEDRQRDQQQSSEHKSDDYGEPATIMYGKMYGGQPQWLKTYDSSSSDANSTYDSSSSDANSAYDSSSSDANSRKQERLQRQRKQKRRQRQDASDLWSVHPVRKQTVDCQKKCYGAATCVSCISAIYSVPWYYSLFRGQTRPPTDFSLLWAWCIICLIWFGVPWCKHSCEHCCQPEDQEPLAYGKSYDQDKCCLGMIIAGALFCIGVCFYPCVPLCCYGKEFLELYCCR